LIHYKERILKRIQTHNNSSETIGGSGCRRDFLYQKSSRFFLFFPGLLSILHKHANGHLPFGRSFHCRRKLVCGEEMEDHQ
jgi:hypothetical protein